MIPPFEIIPLFNFTWTGAKDASAIVSAARLVAGFYDLDQFFVRNGVVIFKTPKTGSTTTNSTKPRSELREQLSPPSNDRNWPLVGEHVLKATCAVNAVPKGQKVYIAQIHGKRWNHPVMKLSYKDKKLWLDVKDGPDGDDDKYDLGSMSLKKFFRYVVRVKDGILTVTANGKSKRVDLVKLGFNLHFADWYFRAGCYGSSAEVAFESLERSHS